MNEIKKKLDALFLSYSTKLPDKLHSIELLWKEQNNSFDTINFQNFHREVHSLCGSAGTYGYLELSKTARQMEIFLKDILNRGHLLKDDHIHIEHHITELKSIVTLTSPDKISFYKTEEITEIENKCVYIIEPDSSLVKQLSDELKQLGYEAYTIQDLYTLEMAIREKHPTAIIINSLFLDQMGIQFIVKCLKKQATPIHLFTILHNTDLTSRLASIRSGCTNFFPKPIDVPYLTHVLNHKCSIISGDPYRILIVDDSEPLANYYALILNQAGMITHAITNPLNLLNEIDSFQPNLLLMDVYMPECTGFELAEVLRQESKYTKIPIIFLSTEENKENKLLAISLGGDDFLTKPIAPQDLISAVRSRSKRAGILNYYMTTDSLTGLLNHSSTLKQLDIQIARCKQANSVGCFMMIDLDHFKKINDTYGHPLGDIVIKKLSSIFLSRLRQQDYIGRYGGEEFAVILPGATIKDSKKITNELRIEFSQSCFNKEGVEFFVTFSAGITRFDGNSTAALIVTEADEALYKAKQLGRNQIHLFRM